MPATTAAPAIAQLGPVVALAKSNVKSTVIEGSIYKVSGICTGRFKSACDAAKLKQPAGQET